MKILMITAGAYLPQRFGGMQTSAHQLIKNMSVNGYDFSVLAGFWPSGWRGFFDKMSMRLNDFRLNCKISRDNVLGYPVWRSWHPWDAVGFVVEKEKPDLIVVMSGKPVLMAMKAKETRRPVLMQLHDVSFNEMGGDLNSISNDVLFVANSYFTAERYSLVFGVKSRIIYPFIDTSCYKVESSRENVTFINPKALKGVDIAIEIARVCNEINFRFVESWTVFDEEKVLLKRRLENIPNVTFVPPQSDMRKIYGKSKIVLVPSLCEEAFGRAACEPQISGIPVLASRRGGLPEAVGDGGVLVDPEQPIGRWVEVLRTMWSDTQFYDALSVAALRHSQREQMTREFQVASWDAAFRDAVANNF